MPQEKMRIASSQEPSSIPADSLPGRQPPGQAQVHLWIPTGHPFVLPWLPAQHSPALLQTFNHPHPPSQTVPSPASCSRGTSAPSWVWGPLPRKCSQIRTGTGRLRWGFSLLPGRALPEVGRAPSGAGTGDGSGKSVTLVSPLSIK